MIRVIIAGGKDVLTRAVECFEDKESEGKKAIDSKRFSYRDLLIGITASGQAPFVIGAMKRAGWFGSKVAAFKPVNNKQVRRLKRIIMVATGCDKKTAFKAFEDSVRKPKTAIVMVLLGVSRQKAEILLAENKGGIGLALEAHHKSL